MNLKVYSTGKAEIYNKGKLVCAGILGARPGQFGYNAMLNTLLTYHFCIDTSEAKEYNLSHG